ncbi:MAG: TIR domain-containing protein [Chloroflexota bacterium]
MSDVFISYSRRDSAFTQKLHDRLAQNEADVWVDWEDIPATADWWAEIKAAIEAADAFAFLITPNSIRSEVCRDEIEHAVDNNKRFIPLLVAPLSNEDMQLLHSEIKTHNWIDFTQTHDDEQAFEHAYSKLQMALTTEPAYIRRHTRLLVRAKEWEGSGRSASYLLKGAELDEFQAWQQQSYSREPKPTDLQYDFILASQTARTRGQLRLAATIVGAVIVLAILSGVALFQQEQIEEANGRSTLAAQERFAQQTQIANLQENARANATNIVIQANAQNTQSALQGQVIALQATIDALAPADAATPTSEVAIESTATALVVYATTTGESVALAPTQGMPTSTAIIATATVITEIQETAVAQMVDTTATANAFDTQQAELIQRTQIAVTEIVATAVSVDETSDSEANPTATPDVVVQATFVASATPMPTSTLQTGNEELPDTGGGLPTGELTITYVVQSGDSLRAIANRFNTTVVDILAQNNIENASVIFIGQQLTITYPLDFGAEDTLFVSPAGDDANDCLTSETACATINGAVSIANAQRSMTEIRIAPGVYNEQLSITSDVALVGNGIENTILTGDFTDTIITTERNTDVFVVGMTVSGGNATWGGGIVNNGEMSLVNVRVSGNVADMAGAGIANFDTLTLSYVDFTENWSPYYSDIYNGTQATIIEGESVSYQPEVILPAVSNTNEDGLRLGALVEVVTTDGSNLNLRERGSTNGSTLAQLPAGTPLLLIGGPQNNNNFRWWEVQTADGTTGWVVDRVDGENTIDWVRP